MSPELDLLGWVLLHFAWQGGVIIAVAALAFRALRGAAPQTRYLVACVAFMAMLAAPLLTAQLLATPSSTVGVERMRRLVRIEIRNWNDDLDAGSPLPFRRPLPPPATPLVELAMTMLGGAWLGGALLLAVRLGGGLIRVHAFHRQASRLADSSWQPEADRIGAQFGVRVPVRVVDADFVYTPTVLGWRAPLIVLPARALSALTPAQATSVLAHELAHVRRHDYLVNLLQALSEALLFCHPGIWWLSQRIRAEREHACDDLAVSVGNDRVGYAAALAELETFRSLQPRLALAMTAGSLGERVQRVLSPAQSNPHTTGAALVATVLFVVIAGSGARAAGYLSAHAPARFTQAAEQDVIYVQWTRFSTDHFEVFVPPALEPRLIALGELAERIYRQIATDLRHDIATRPHLLLFEDGPSLERLVASGVASIPRAEAVVRLAVDRTDPVVEAVLSREITRLFEAEILGGR